MATLILSNEPIIGSEMSAALNFNLGGQTQKVVAWINPLVKKRPFAASFWVAIAMHGLLFFVGGLVFSYAPEYGVQLSSGGLDVELVAAPMEGSSIPTLETQAPSEAMVAPELQMPAVSPALQAPELPAPEMAKVQSKKFKGDGSSSAPGEDATTLSSSGSGQAYEKPGYLKNPPPPYPAEAIRKEQEGLVVLLVSVNRNGNVEKAEIRQSSGFRILDQAALKAIKKWKFSPGRMGALTVDTQVDIPIRFRLEDLKR